jgi:TetR/AcrR family transcriptional repressor of nem operon
MRYDAEHRQQTREKVVRKAAEAIREFGPDKISVAELMAKVGLTHGGFYAHFKSKDDLVSEAIAYIFNERYKAARWLRLPVISRACLSLCVNASMQICKAKPI